MLIDFRCFTRCFHYAIFMPRQRCYYAHCLRHMLSLIHTPMLPYAIAVRALHYATPRLFSIRFHAAAASLSAFAADATILSRR